MDKRQLEMELELVQVKEQYKETVEKMEEAESSMIAYRSQQGYLAAKQISLEKKLKELSLPKKGKLCMFWDGEENGKPVRPMIRPYAGTGTNDYYPRGVKHFSEDWEGNRIGHGWTNCRPVTLQELANRVQE